MNKIGTESHKQFGYEIQNNMLSDVACKLVCELMRHIADGLQLYNHHI